MNFFSNTSIVISLNTNQKPTFSNIGDKTTSAIIFAYNALLWLSDCAIFTVLSQIYYTT